MKHILLNNLGSKQSGNEIWSVYVILQKNKLVLGPFLVFKESL